MVLQAETDATVTKETTAVMAEPVAMVMPAVMVAMEPQVWQDVMDVMDAPALLVTTDWMVVLVSMAWTVVLVLMVALVKRVPLVVMAELVAKVKKVKMVASVALVAMACLADKG
jgi:uncharacterized protein YybS (DUF2232 family)